MKKSFFIFACCLFLFSCKKEEFVHPDYIVFGAFQGDCAGGCRFVYYLDYTALKEDVTVKYFSTGNLGNFDTTLTNAEFLLVKDLIHKVPVALTKTNRTLFTDLNAANPNLWYAEIKLNGRIYKWTFDNSPSSTPSYLKPFANEVINTALTLR